MARKTCRTCGGGLHEISVGFNQCMSELSECALRAALRRTRKALRVAKRGLAYIWEGDMDARTAAMNALADIRRAERGK